MTYAEYVWSEFHLLMQKVEKLVAAKEAENKRRAA